MSVYLIFIGILIIQWLLLYPHGIINFNITTNCRQRKIFCILVCIELICFAGVRAIDLGADTVMYVRGLNYYSAMPQKDILTAKLVYPFSFEAGYFFLTKVCAWLSMNETMFLTVIAMSIYIPVVCFIYKYSEKPLISILAYFSFGCFAYSLGIFRQMIALSIILSGIKYIENRKLVKYIIIVAIAMLFHRTAIIMLPLYWIAQINIKNKLKWIFLSEIFVFAIAREIIVVATKILPVYAGYINSIYDVQGGSYMMLILLNIILLFAYFMVQRQENQGNTALKIAVNATVCAIFLQILGYSMEIFGRLVPYYSIFLLILLPCLLDGYFVKNKLLVRIVCILGLIIMFYWLNKNSVIVPYRTILLG